MRHPVVRVPGLAIGTANLSFLNQNLLLSHGGCPPKPVVFEYLVGRRVAIQWGSMAVRHQTTLLLHPVAMHHNIPNSQEVLNQISAWHGLGVGSGKQGVPIV